jgi:hypothetical protein
MALSVISTQLLATLPGTFSEFPKICKTYVALNLIIFSLAEPQSLAPTA